MSYEELKEQAAQYEGRITGMAEEITRLREALRETMQERDEADKELRKHGICIGSSHDELRGGIERLAYALTQDAEIARLNKCLENVIDKRDRCTEAKVEELENALKIARDALAFYGKIVHCKITSDADRKAHGYKLSDDAGDVSRTALAAIAQEVGSQ